MKNIRFFLSKISVFGVKFLIYLNRRVIVMKMFCAWSHDRESEPGHCISYKIKCAPSEDPDQPAHTRSLIRNFAVHSVGSQGSKASSGGQRWLINWSVSSLVAETLCPGSLSRVMKYDVGFRLSTSPPVMSFTLMIHWFGIPYFPQLFTSFTPYLIFLFNKSILLPLNAV